MQPEQRREQLIDAALRVIVEQGYEGVSIEAIARTAGVTRPVIYDHFPNLGRLLQALIEREENYALAQLAEVVPESPQEGDLPQHVRGRGAPLPRRGRQPARHLADHPAPARGHSGDHARHAETNRAQVLERLQQFVSWAIDRSEIPVDLDVEICARAILSLSEEAGRMVLTDPERFSPERYERFARTVMDLIWTGR